jgi:hypothetical protein
MSGTKTSQRWSNFGSSAPASTAVSYRSVSASPTHFLSLSNTKLNNLSIDLLYPTPSIPAQPKDSSELLRRSLLISNAMTAAKKQVRTERMQAYDEKRNTISRGLRGSSPSFAHSLSRLEDVSESEPTQGRVREPTQAHSIEAEEGEEWFEETWRELMHEDERDSAMFGQSAQQSVTVRSQYQEFTSTQTSEFIYTAGIETKDVADVHVEVVESESSSAGSSRSTSPVSVDTESVPVEVEGELIAVNYVQPIVLPSQVLGIATITIDDSDIPELSLDALDFEYIDNASSDTPVLARSASSSAPRKPRLLPTIIRDKFYEPSRFESEVEEADPALAFEDIPALEQHDETSFDIVHVESIYSSSPTESLVSDSDDEEDSTILRTPDETVMDEFGYSADSASPSSSFDEGVEAYFASGYASTSKTSSVDWDPQFDGSLFT